MFPMRSWASHESGHAAWWIATSWSAPWHDATVSAPDLTAAMMSQFAESGADRHLTLLLGAGASTSSGLPDWDELAIRLLLRSKAVSSREAAAMLVERQDPLLVAEAARKAPGANWNRSVQAALYHDVAGPTPTALHIAAAGHLLAGDGTDTTLVTLNFDTLLESAIRDGTTEPVESRIDAERSAGSHAVHHLHGIVATDEVRGVVLTLSDFNELLGDSDSWQLTMLRRAIRSGALVIAGTSYRDPDLRRWLHVALAEQPREHAALVLLARQGFGLTRTEFAEVENALAGQWGAVGLEPVILEDFTDAAQIVRELRHVHDSGYRAPQERARDVWNAHAAAFDALQPVYSDQLAEDADVLRTALDVDQLNVTLWLADANGRIARWAAQDRRYRAVGDLRLIDSGHDSRWIAGQALGGENILFQDLDTPGTRRWSTVLAVPIRVEHSGLPEFATAVISVGLPGAAKDYEPSAVLWLDSILTIANAWSTRLVEATFPTTAPTLK